ncbi:MAG: serine/threonine-protein kinase, partial [Dermatophilaceae bacterium]
RVMITPDRDGPTPVDDGRFTFVRKLGSGAFATVWLAQDQTLGVPVAIKVLADNWLDDLDVRERFLDEARLSRQAANEYLATIYDLGELPNGRPHIVMVYADRGTLADRLSRSPLPVGEAVRIGMDLGSGLASLHEHGILHRDLKPSNVLFKSGSGGTERTLISDLGLAKRMDQLSAFTFGAGTLGFAAPEQLVVGGDLDMRADVYSLGAVIRAMVFGAPTAPMDDQVAPDVRDLLTRTTAQERAERPASVLDFLDELSGTISWPDRDATGAGSDSRRGASIGAGRTWVSVPDKPGGAPSRAPARTHAARRPAGRRSKTRAWGSAGRPVRVAVLGGVLALIAALAGAVTAFVRDDGQVVLSSEEAGISVAVPQQWARQIQSSTWLSPTRSSPVSGFAVSADLGGWAESQTPMAGMFVATAGPEMIGLVYAAASHPQCAIADPVDWSGARFEKASVVRWSQCPSGVDFHEAVLKEADTDRVVYVQVKNAEEQQVRSLLSSLRTG